MRHLGLIGLLIACGEPQPPLQPGLAPLPCLPETAHYVVSSISLASNFDEVSDYGFRPTLGEASTLSNSLGALRGLLAAEAPRLDDILTARMASGELLWLIQVDRCNTDVHARVAFAVGIDADADRSNNFSGSAVLIPATGFGTAAVDASFAGPNLQAVAGTAPAPVSLFLDVDADTTPVMWLDTYLAVADGSVEDDELVLRMGVGVRAIDMPSLAPALARTANHIVETDMGCPEACAGSLAQAIVDTVDVDQDGTVTPGEINDARQLDITFGLDLDVITLYQGQTVYWPGRDGQPDHRSLGLRITAVPFTLTSQADASHLRPRSRYAR